MSLSLTGLSKDKHATKQQKLLATGGHVLESNSGVDLRKHHGDVTGEDAAASHGALLDPADALHVSEHDVRNDAAPNADSCYIGQHATRCLRAGTG